MENLLLKVEKSIKELYSLRFNKNSLKEKVFSLENKIKNIKIDELREKFNILKEELNEISKKLGSSQEKIENFKKILEKITSQEEKQKKLLDELKKLEDKSNRANLIRNEVGKWVELFLNICLVVSVTLLAWISIRLQEELKELNGAMTEKR